MKAMQEQNPVAFDHVWSSLSKKHYFSARPRVVVNQSSASILADQIPLAFLFGVPFLIIIFLTTASTIIAALAGVGGVSIFSVGAAAALLAALLSWLPIRYFSSRASSLPAVLKFSSPAERQVTNSTGNSMEIATDSRLILWKGSTKPGESSRKIVHPLLICSIQSNGGVFIPVFIANNSLHDWKRCAVHFAKFADIPLAEITIPDDSRPAGGDLWRLFM